MLELHRYSVVVLRRGVVALVCPRQLLLHVDPLDRLRLSMYLNDVEAHQDRGLLVLETEKYPGEANHRLTQEHMIGMVDAEVILIIMEITMEREEKEVGVIVRKAARL